MDITKRDSKMLKGVAILSMLVLHLFCRKDNLPYTPLLWIGSTPLFIILDNLEIFVWQYIVLSADMLTICNLRKQICGNGGNAFCVF